MATDLQIIIDDNSEAFYYAGSWSKRTRFAGGMSRVALGPLLLSTFEFTFEGTSAIIIGTSELQGLGISIDGVQFVEGRSYSTPSDDAGNYRQLFQTPKLSDGRHTIGGNCTSGTTIDFATVNVTAGNRTSLAGRDIIVDNDSPTIFYSGHWNRNTSQMNDTYNLGYPYGNSTHRSSTPGDSFTFRFTGTSVSLYGIYSWFNPGTLGATYTLDGASVPQAYNVTSTDEVQGEWPNYVYYVKDDLTAGDHTLTVNITMANNLTFMLDYITYKPSVETALSSPTPTITSVSTTSPSQVKTAGTPKTGAIVGGVIGVLALGVFAAMLGRWLFLRRKAGQTDNIFIYDDANGLHMQNPNQYYQQYIPQLRPQDDYPLASRQPLRYGTPEQATASNSNLPPLPGTRNAAEEDADPPPYDTLSSARPEVMQHITASCSHK